MLPAPSLSFTIPSVHDDTVLDCRIYLPPSYTTPGYTGVDPICTQRRKKAAIVAHPYGPMGGSYNDPIVDLVAGSILKQGFVVGTFNFRGAGDSKGRTSWTAKAEVNDYISMVGFMVHFMHKLQHDTLSQSWPDDDDDDDELKIHDLSPIPSHVLPARQVLDRGRKRYSKSALTLVTADEFKESSPLLLMGGYSYGAMITTLLPSLPTILSQFATPKLGTAASEICLRAVQLAHKQNDIITTLAQSLQLQSKSESNLLPAHKRGRSLQLSPRKISSSSGVRIGGEESNPDDRHQSYEMQHRWSMDPTESIRRSVDLVRSVGRRSRNGDGQMSPVPKRYSSNGSAISSTKRSVRGKASVASLDFKPEKTACERSTMQEVLMPDIQAAYLLISPLQGLVNNLATMWSAIPRTKPKDGEQSEEEIKLVSNHTLAIYGDTDVFTSTRKLRIWSDRLKSANGSSFQSEEISGAGHFWHEEGLVYLMRDFAKEFVRSL